jgi:SpoIID/LytB domain protein
MTVKRRVLCIVIALLLAVAPAALSRGIFGTASSEGGITASSISDDGIIRVYLKSLGDPQSLLLTLAGEYVVGATGAFRFERGTQVTVAASDGALYLSVGGLTLDMGPAFTFNRCAAEDGAENGIYIYESERNALFAGDLKLACDGNSLVPILSIGVEDYLCGVIAYEMSDSFPIEALKAQAVAARTYAMNRKAARTGSAYDVVDTTGDQVYKGLVADDTNVIAAVEATRGVVGTYKGTYASCYYTASNGGQVATPNQIWGGDGDYSYIEQKDDPYDVENPKSLVNSYFVPDAYDSASELYQMLDARLDKSGHADLRIDSIADIALSSPKFEGSLMRKSMDFTLNLSARDPGWVPVDYESDRRLGWALGYAFIGDTWYERGIKDWEPLSETVTISLSVYDELKDELALGLNSSDCEIASAVREGAGWSIEYRRFGHGVGMSQRGAQWMAGEYGKDYIEILSFYYPGMALEKIDWNSPALPAFDELPAAIAAEQMLIPPAEAALPALGTGEFYAHVLLSNAKSRLNVRSEPSTDATVVAKLDSGYRLIVVELLQDDWAKVKTASFSGYVKAEYIQAE